MTASPFNACIAAIQDVFSTLPDKRTGKNQSIQMKDIGLSAFSVFFTQCASFLEHQRTMHTREADDNAHSLFGIDHIPSDNHIRAILDDVPPTEIFPLFDSFLNLLEVDNVLDEFRHLDNQFLLALDGLHYFSSKNISCDQCSQQHHRNGEITYSHSMMSAALVHPKHREVLPLIPMFVEPQDGHEKQDCEREACKRWLLGPGRAYSKLGVILLGDDLYCCEPICRLAQQQGYHFIFTCKPDSHICLYDWIESLERGDHLHNHTGRIATQKGTQVWHCRYVNEVPLCDGKEALHVNWCEVEVVDVSGNRLYHNAFATDYPLTDANVIKVVRAGRTRWKTENEHNNTLKNHGYHLAHNFGHGKKYLASLIATLILLSFLMHTVLRLTDQDYRTIRDHFPRQAFFNQLRTLLMYLLFARWTTVMAMMLNACRSPPRRKKKRR